MGYIIGRFDLTKRLFEINMRNLNKMSSNSDKGYPLFLNEDGDFIFMMHWGAHWAEYWEDPTRKSCRKVNERIVSFPKCVGVVMCQGYSNPSKILRYKDIAMNLYCEYAGCVYAKLVKRFNQLQLKIDYKPDQNTRTTLRMMEDAEDLRYLIDLNS